MMSFTQRGFSIVHLRNWSNQLTHKPVYAYTMSLNLNDALSLTTFQEHMVLPELMSNATGGCDAMTKSSGISP